MDLLTLLRDAFSAAVAVAYPSAPPRILRLEPSLEALTQLVAQMVKRRGLVRDADALARLVGFSSSRQLRRFLKAHAIRGIGDLAAVVRVLTILGDARTHRLSLEDISLRDGVDPAVDARRIRRVLALTWAQACRLPQELVLAQCNRWLRREVRGPAREVSEKVRSGSLAPVSLRGPRTMPDIANQGAVSDRHWSRARLKGPVMGRNAPK
jgi:hypothetical protein